MKLRWYQEEAVQAVYNHLRERKDNPCVVMPTGAGKSPTIGRIVRDAVEEWDGRVAIVAHRKELLVQNAEKIQLFAPKLPVGIYSAGLGRRDTAQPVIVGGIQSIYKRAFEFGRFDLILVDEAHLIPTDGEGRYRQFLAEAVIANPDVRVIGFTATPYRCDSGVICAPGNILNEVCYEIGVRPLITQGFLSRPVPKSGEAEAIVDTTGVHTRGGEFVQGELEERATDLDIVRSACREIVALTQDRKSVV